MAAAYREMGIPAVVSAFVAEVGDALATADLVVCRGGASTLAEVASLGRPAAIVPYPHHADRQQWRNAGPLLARKAAVALAEEALSPDEFDREVVGLLLDADRRRAMEEAARAEASRPGGERDPATALARDLVRFIGDRVGARRAGPGRTSARPGAAVRDAPVEAAPACPR